MNLHKTMEKIAGRTMTEAEALQFCKDQWGLVVSWLDEHGGERTGYFKVTSVAREDLTGSGFDTTLVSDETMERLASKMADAYCDNGFWVDLQLIAEDLEIPKSK